MDENENGSAEMQAPASAAVATPPPKRIAGSGPIPFEANSLDDVWRAANWIAKSDLLPSHLRGNAANCAVVIMKGRDFGLSAMASIGGIHVVDGKPGMSAALMVGLARRSVVCKRFDILEMTATRSKIVAQRTDGAPLELTYTMEEAKKITYKTREGVRNLVDKDNWKNYPTDMLFSRNASRMCRAMFQDVFLGPVYSEDELDPDSDGGNGPAPRSKRGTAMNRTLDDVLADDEAPPSNGSRAVVVEAEDAAKSTPAAEPSAEKPADTPHEPDDAERRVNLIAAIVEHQQALKSDELEAVFAKAGVAFDVESYEVLSTKDLSSLLNALIVAKAGKSAPPKPETPPAAAESALARDVRLISAARSGQQAKFREAIEKLKLPKTPASTWTIDQRAAIIREIYGDAPPA